MLKWFSLEKKCQKKFCKQKKIKIKKREERKRGREGITK